MKYIIVLACTVLTIGINANNAVAQTFLQKVKDKLKTKVNNRVDQKTDATMDKGLDAAEAALEKKRADSVAAANGTAPAGQQPAAGSTAGSGAAAAPQQNNNAIKVYANYDFVPGDTILFEDHFTDDADGEFPSHWDLKAGQAILNKMGDDLAFLLTDGNYAKVQPLMTKPSYLTDNFTVEYDLFSNGSYPLKVDYFKQPGTIEGDYFAVYVEGNGGVQYSPTEGESLSGNLPPDVGGDNFPGKWHHIALAVKKMQLKVYVDQNRVLVVPRLPFATTHLDMEGIGDHTNPIVFKNVRIASGGNMNMLGKKFTDAKIITHGINFDIDKATIKPESMGTLNMIVQVLKDNPDLKFEVDGHTDNSGTAAHNLTLSQQRADAVKNQLVSMGVDATRLTTKGFGDTKPISDNTSIEGKANNRRVEFVRM